MLILESQAKRTKTASYSFLHENTIRIDLLLKPQADNMTIRLVG